MGEREQLYENAVNQIASVCDAMLKRDNYMEKMPECIIAINQAVVPRMEEAEDEVSYILQVLEDMMYGMSQQDEVFLLDALRFGVLPLFEQKYRSIADGGQG